MTSGAALVRGLAWAAAIAVVAYYTGLYELATDWPPPLFMLLPLAAASLGLVFLFRAYPQGIALVNYQLCLLMLWHGHFYGMTALLGGCDIAWFCISCLWPWLFFAVVGGIAVVATARATNAPPRATTRAAAAILLLVGGLLVVGFAHLRMTQAQPLVQFRAARFTLQGLAVSPDGQTVATLGAFTRVRLWSAASGRFVSEFESEEPADHWQRRTLQGFGDPPVIAASAYEPRWPEPGGAIVVQTWDLTTRKPLLRRQWNDELAIRRPVFSRDGRWFVYAADGLRAFDLEAETIVVDVRPRSAGRIVAVAVAPDRLRLACATEARALEIWEPTGDAPLQTIHTTRDIACLEFSPDGRHLAYGLEGGAIEEIEIGDDTSARALPCFESGRVEAIAYAPDGALLACAGGEDGSTRLVDVKRWAVIAALKTWGAWRPAYLAFSRDGARLATGDTNGLVALWDMTKPAGYVKGL